jgi:hypothetical protein
MIPQNVNLGPKQQVSLVDREPVLITTALLAVVESALTLLMLFKVIDVTPEQATAILGFVAVVITLVNTLYVRGKVTPLADPKNNEGEPLVALKG